MKKKNSNSFSNTMRISLKHSMNSELKKSYQFQDLKKEETNKPTTAFSSYQTLKNKLITTHQSARLSSSKQFGKTKLNIHKLKGIYAERTFRESLIDFNPKCIFEKIILAKTPLTSNNKDRDKENNLNKATPLSPKKQIIKSETSSCKYFSYNLVRLGHKSSNSNLIFLSPKVDNIKGKNIGVNYLDLAKKLRNNKILEGNNFSNNCTHTNNSGKNKDNKIENKLNIHARSISTFAIKSTKDSSFKMLNNSFKAKNEIDGPEDLHLFYVNILQQNKELAFKFEKYETEDDAPEYL
jgi:hypothetical protein